MTRVVAARRVAELLARVDRVRTLTPAELDTFLKERIAAEALILNLYLALQATTDLALHLVAERGLGIPASARDAFFLLERATLLSPELARRLAAAVGLRNRIAHQYGTLDLALVFGAARDDLGDLEAFAAMAARAFELDA